MSDKVTPINDSPGALEFRVRTTWEWQKITSVIDLFGGEKLLQRISYKVVQIQERQYQLALINLGWTPPDEIAEQIDNDNLLGEDNGDN